MPGCDRPNNQRDLWMPAIGVAAAAVLVYLVTFPGAFFLDDVQIVAANPLVTHPDLLAILRSDYWGEHAHSGLYRPLTILSFALNRAFLGSQPWSYHLVNVLLHAATAVALLVLLDALGCRRLVATGAAALFAVHPLHAEAVNMAVGRSELLVGLLLVAALWQSVVATQRLPWPVPLCYLLALLAKEHAVVLLALLPALDGFRSAQPLQAWRRRLPLYLTLLAVTLAWLAWRQWGVLHADIPRDPYDPVYAPLAFLPALARVLTALQLQGEYLLKLLVPVGLQGVYGGKAFLQPIPGFGPPAGLAVLAGCGLYLLVTAVALRRRHLLGLVLCLYAGSWLVTANILFPTGVTFAGRLAYLPSAWFCFGLVAAVDGLVPARHRRWALAGIALLVAAYAVGGVVHNRSYRDPLTLWQHDVASDAQDPLAWQLLANAQELAGASAEAETSYRVALQLAPDFADAHRNLGALLYRQERYREAVAAGRQAAQSAQGTYGSAYVLLARAHLRLGEWTEALEAVERLPEFQRRRYGLVWELRGLALEGLGDAAGAAAAYAREVEVEPQRPSDVYRRLGRAALKAGDALGAEQAYRNDLQRAESAEAWNGLGVALRLQGRSGEAAQAFARAVDAAAGGR